MNKSVQEVLEAQHEEIVSQLGQTMVQLALMQNMKNMKILMPGVQNVLRQNIELLVIERDRIQKGLAVLEDSDDPEDEIKALLIAHTGYAETLH
jgi:hypothetical protein